MEKRFLINSILAGAALLALAACQGSDPLKRESNPRKDYPALNEAIPFQEQTKHTQSYAGDLFAFDVDNGTNKKFVFNFTQGVNKSYTVNFRTMVENVSYKANLELPEELKGKVSWSASGSSWVLSWTPSAQLIPATKGSMTYDAKINLIPSTTDTKAQKLLANKDLSIPVVLTVQRQEAEPKVLKVEGINEKAVYKADQPLKVRIVVSDPAMGEQRDPVISFKQPIGKFTAEQIEKKGYVMSVNSLYLVKATKVGGAGTWAMDYSFEPAAFVRDAELNNVNLSALPDVITVVTSASVVSYGQTSPEINVAIQIENPKKKTEAKLGAKK